VYPALNSHAHPRCAARTGSAGSFAPGRKARVKRRGSHPAKPGRRRTGEPAIYRICECVIPRSLGRTPVHSDRTVLPDEGRVIERGLRFRAHVELPFVRNQSRKTSGRAPALTAHLEVKARLAELRHAAAILPRKVLRWAYSNRSAAISDPSRAVIGPRHSSVFQRAKPRSAPSPQPERGRASGPDLEQGRWGGIDPLMVRPLFKKRSTPPATACRPPSTLKRIGRAVAPRPARRCAVTGQLAARNQKIDSRQGMLTPAHRIGSSRQAMRCRKVLVTNFDDRIPRMQSMKSFHAFGAYSP
jgi:hypothetical protein